MKKKNTLKGMISVIFFWTNVLFLTSNALAVSYYVSDSGDDSNNGCCDPLAGYNDCQGCSGNDGPWQTIAKVNDPNNDQQPDLFYQAGDVIKFMKGDVWNLRDDEPLDVPDSNLTITSYDGSSSDNPLITDLIELVDAGSYEWWESGATDEYYLTGLQQSDPQINNPGNRGVLVAHYLDEEPFMLKRGGEWKTKDQMRIPHTPGALDNFEWAWGYNETLRFYTIYIKDPAGKPGNAGGFISVKANQGTANGGITIWNKSYVTIDGLDIKGFGDPGISIRLNASHITIRNLSVSFCDFGILAAFQAGEYNEIYNCTIQYNYKMGIASLENSEGWRYIRNNVCSYNGQAGIFVAQPHKGCTIEHNLTEYNGWYDQAGWSYNSLVIKSGLDSQTIYPRIVRYNVCRYQRKGDTPDDGGGIHIRSDNAEVYYNLCYLNAGNGISACCMDNEPVAEHKNFKVFNNVCYKNCQTYGRLHQSDLLFYPGVHDFVVKNNIIYRDEYAFSNHFIRVDNTINATIDNNCYYPEPGSELLFRWNRIDRTWGYWQNTFHNDENGFSDDPGLIEDASSNNFLQIQSDLSPCIDAGSANVRGEFTGFPGKDIWGNDVPSPKCVYTSDDYDIGAHEYQGVDVDDDGFLDDQDNCLCCANGQSGGTCTSGNIGDPCTSDGDCGTGGFCSMNQEDSYPPQGNNIGDACDCEADFDCDGDVDGDDITTFMTDYGRSQFNDPCTNDVPCNGDFNCDGNVAGPDVEIFLNDLGRNQYNNPCPACVMEDWCAYPPQDNEIGDTSDCEGNFDCDGDLDADDVTAFLTDYGRSQYNNPCTNDVPCNGDFNCDGNVAGPDVEIFLKDLGRNQHNNPCPACVVEDWCVYP